MRQLSNGGGPACTQRIEDVRTTKAEQLGRQPTDNEWLLAASVPTMDELRRRCNNGRVARERMICANMRLVVSCSKRYQNQGLTLLDLWQEGNLGLMKVCAAPRKARLGLVSRLHALGAGGPAGWLLSSVRARLGRARAWSDTTQTAASACPRTCIGGSAKPSRVLLHTRAAPSVCPCGRWTPSTKSTRRSRSTWCATARCPTPADAPQLKCGLEQLIERWCTLGLMIETAFRTAPWVQDDHDWTEPSEEQLAELTGMSVARVKTVLRASHPVCSLDVLGGGIGGSSFTPNANGVILVRTSSSNVALRSPPLRPPPPCPTKPTWTVVAIVSVACGWIRQDTDDRAHSKWSNSPGNVMDGAGEEDRQHFMMGNEEASSCVMSVEQTLLEEEVMDSLSKSLCPREMQVLKLRYGLSGQRATSPADMGELLGISRERVRQIEKGALKKVMADDTHNLREFLWML